MSRSVSSRLSCSEGGFAFVTVPGCPDSIFCSIIITVRPPRLCYTADGSFPARFQQWTHPTFLVNRISHEHERRIR